MSTETQQLVLQMTQRLERLAITTTYTEPRKGKIWQWIYRAEEIQSTLTDWAPVTGAILLMLTLILIAH